MSDRKNKGNTEANGGKTKGPKKKADQGSANLNDAEANKSLGDDYWDRVAEDPASGYKNEEGRNSILNEDQEPHDNERGDLAS